MIDSYKMQNGTKVYTDSGERPSLAAFVLGYFASLKGNRRVLELCSGSGTASFWNYDRGFRGETVMVDIRREPLEIAEKTASENSFNVTAVQADAGSYRDGRLFDAVVCNPPFFDEADVSRQEDRSAVRHENGLTPSVLCAAAALNLKQRGHFYMCHVPDRLPDIFQSLRENGLEPKNIRFCRHTADRAPFLVLIDSIYRGGKKLTVLPDIIVFDSEGRYTEEMMDICERGYV